MAKKVQQTTEATVIRVRPLWRAENNIITLVNEDALIPEQVKYLKPFVGKTSSSTRIEELKAVILQNEGELVKKPAPKKEQPEKLTKEQVQEATKSAKEEVAPTSDSKEQHKKVVSKKGKGVKKSVEKSEKPKEQPKRNPLRGSKTTDMYDSDTIYEEGQLVQYENLYFKVLSEDARPKIGQWAFIPKFEGADGRDCFMRIDYIGKATVWLLEPFYSENMIPIGPDALASHFLDEVDEKGEVIPDEEWIPFYLVEMTSAPKKEEPKEEVEKVEQEQPKAEEKPKTTKKKPSVKKKTTKTA